MNKIAIFCSASDHIDPIYAEKASELVHGLVKPESGSFMEVRIQDLWRLLPALQKKMEL